MRLIRTRFASSRILLFDVVMFPAELGLQASFYQRPKVVTCVIKRRIDKTGREVL
jgi:hypothetical protein